MPQVTKPNYTALRELLSRLRDKTFYTPDHFDGLLNQALPLEEEAKEEKNKTSEFGKGFVYSLILFSKHWWQHFDYLKAYKSINTSEARALGVWFNGAADHLFELTIPEQFKETEVGKLALDLQERGLKWRLSDDGLNQKSFDQFFEDLERLAMLLDKQLGVDPVKASWN